MSTLSRRSFLRHSALAGGGLLVAFTLPGCSTPPSLPVPKESGDFVPNAFLKFTADGAVHFYCPRDEMGQGVTTGLTTIVAEGLDMAPRRLTVELAGAHPDYANPGRLPGHRQQHLGEGALHPADDRGVSNARPIPRRGGRTRSRKAPSPRMTA